MNPEEWEGPDLPAHRSPLTYPACECGANGCPDQPNSPGPERTHEEHPRAGADSPVLQDLRARVREENDRRRFGRSG